MDQIADVMNTEELIYMRLFSYIFLFMNFVNGHITSVLDAKINVQRTQS